MVIGPMSDLTSLKASLASAQFHAPASQSKIAAATQETAGAEDGAMRHGKANS